MSVVKEISTGVAPDVGFAGPRQDEFLKALWYFSAIRKKCERPLGPPN